MNEILREHDKRLDKLERDNLTLGLELKALSNEFKSLAKWIKTFTTSILLIVIEEIIRGSIS